MAQISRPYQIALVAIMFLALAWFVVLRGHGASSESTASSAPSTSTPAVSPTPSASNSSSLAAEEAKKAATSTPVVKGTAPGVEGLSRAVNKAHEAVATSQHNAEQLASKSAQASGEAPSSTSSTAAQSAAGAGAAGSAAASKVAPTEATKAKAKSTVAHNQHSKTVHRTNTVESELKAGKTVLILFWNPAGSGDRAVRQQVEAVKGKMKKHVAVHYSRPREVGSYGSITRNIPVYQTPTLLVVASNKQVTTLTGLPDAYGIEQAIHETKH